MVRRTVAGVELAGEKHSTRPDALDRGSVIVLPKKHRLLVVSE